MLQWCGAPDAVFCEVQRVLRPGGFFAFSTFGPDTLRELREAWRAADGHTHVNRFIDLHDLGSALGRAGLTEPVLDVERISVDYPDVMTLMRDLKAIGAHNVTAGRSRGLTGRQALRRMTDAYEALRRDGSLPASYEIIYGAAWGGERAPAGPRSRSEARIPVSAIRRRHGA
jgi:malonyl-CoA O-methyltransferase